MEGTEDGLWSFSDPEKQRELLADYRARLAASPLVTPLASSLRLLSRLTMVSKKSVSSSTTRILNVCMVISI